jgi:hypothetical protein
MDIQPIYIYTLENNISFTDKNTYIITDLQPNDKRHLYRKYQRLLSYKTTIYCSKNLLINIKSFDLVELPKYYLASVDIISFNELLELIEQLNMYSNMYSKDVLEVINILHIVLAKWDEWY